MLLKHYVYIIFIRLFPSLYPHSSLSRSLFLSLAPTQQHFGGHWHRWLICIWVAVAVGVCYDDGFVLPVGLMVDFGSQIGGFVTTIVALALARKPHSLLPPTHSTPPPSSQSHLLQPLLVRNPPDPVLIPDPPAWPLGSIYPSKLKTKREALLLLPLHREGDG